MAIDRANRPRFLELLEHIRFADRYYELCQSHPERGAELPVERQQVVLEVAGRAFKYDKREKFFQHRDPEAPLSCKLGVNFNFRDSSVEAILVVATPEGHLGSPFAGLASDVKRYRDPTHRHDPPYPTPGFKSELEAREVITALVALYDEVKQAFIGENWT